MQHFAASSKERQFLAVQGAPNIYEVAHKPVYVEHLTVGENYNIDNFS